MLYSAAPEVRDIAAELIFDNGRHLSCLRSIPMTYAFFSDAKGKLADQTGKTVKVSGLAAVLIHGLHEEMEGVDPADCERFVVLINRQIFRLLKEPRQKEAIVYHQLLRCALDEKGKLSVEDPDIMAFSSEIRIYGEELQSVRRFLSALEKGGQTEMPFDGNGATAENGDGARPHGMDPEPMALPAPMLALSPPALRMIAAPVTNEEDVIEGEIIEGEVVGSEHLDADTERDEVAA